MSVANAYAQDYAPNGANRFAPGYKRYRYLPRAVPNPDRDPQLPVEPRDVSGDPAILVKELKALIFVDHRDKVVSADPNTKGIEVRSDGGLQLLRTIYFQQIAESYLGKPISYRRLNELVRDIVVFYRNHDQPVVDVSIPEHAGAFLRVDYAWQTAQLRTLPSPRQRVHVGMIVSR